MPIKSPGKHTGAHASGRSMKGGHGKVSPIADLNVTPMVDFLTVLVIFLLMTFSASGEILFITKEITLPKAYHAGNLDRAPVIAVSAVSVAYEGEGVMDTSTVNSRWYPDWELPPLFERLDRAKKSWKELHPDDQFSGQIIIQSDGQVPFEVIKMIMFTCAKAGYLNVSFAVQKGDQSVVGGAGA